jgi:hypothetical protein
MDRFMIWQRKGSVRALQCCYGGWELRKTIDRMSLLYIRQACDMIGTGVNVIVLLLCVVYNVNYSCVCCMCDLCLLSKSLSPKKKNESYLRAWGYSNPIALLTNTRTPRNKSSCAWKGASFLSLLYHKNDTDTLAIWSELRYIYVYESIYI